MKILTVDEHPIIRIGLSTVLEGMGSILEAGTLDELPQVHCNHEDVDVAVVHMEREGAFVGSLIAKQITSLWPKIKVCFFTAMDEGHFAALAYESGYHGWLHKSATPQIIRRAIEYIAAGKRWFMEEDMERSGRFSVANFTRREIEVLLLLSIGVTNNDDIAQVLGVTRSTVKTHLFNARQRVGLETKNDLLQYAVCRSVFF